MIYYDIQLYDTFVGEDEKIKHKNAAMNVFACQTFENHKIENKAPGNLFCSPPAGALCIAGPPRHMPSNPVP